MSCSLATPVTATPWISRSASVRLVKLPFCNSSALTTVMLAGASRTVCSKPPAVMVMASSRI